MDDGERQIAGRRLEPPADLVRSCRYAVERIGDRIALSSRPAIFISAVSRELRSARQLVANTLTFLGYEPVWQEIFGLEGGDLREVLRQRIDQCQGVVQLVGQCYGAEPPAPDENFGRVSYTQYEALYARLRGKKSGICSSMKLSRSISTSRRVRSCASCKRRIAGGCGWTRIYFMR